MKQLSIFLSAFAAVLTVAGAGFFDFPEDKGRALPADKVYPNGRIFPIMTYSARNPEQFKKDGFTVVKEARGKGISTPILLLSAQGNVEYIVKGLDLGADDYMVKPINVNEMVLRVGALLRRSQVIGAVPLVLSFETIRMEEEKHVVTVKGEACELTYKEYELLKRLLQNPNIVLTRDQLLLEIWGYDFDGTEEDYETVALRIVVFYPVSCVFIKRLENAAKWCDRAFLRIEQFVCSYEVLYLKMPNWCREWRGLAGDDVVLKEQNSCEPNMMDKFFKSSDEDSVYRSDMAALVFCVIKMVS